HVPVSERLERGRDLLRLPVAHLEHERPCPRALGESLLQAGPDEGDLGLEAKLRLRTVERAHVRRVGDDEVPALRRRLETGEPQLDLQVQALRVLTREAEGGL